MNILDLVIQYLESRGFVQGPHYTPGCFFLLGSGFDRLGSKDKIVLYRSDGKGMTIARTKEPTVVIVYRGWLDENRSSLLDLTDPGSLENLGHLIDE